MHLGYIRFDMIKFRELKIFLTLKVTLTYITLIDLHVCVIVDIVLFIRYRLHVMQLMHNNGAHT